MNGFVYVIRPIGMVGPVKIGFSHCPPTRVISLMAWSPFPLEIVAAFPGDRLVENNIHSCLADSHSHHEWFRPTTDVLSFVSRVEGGASLIEAIDLSKIQGSIRTKTFISDESREYRSWNMRFLYALKKVPKKFAKSYGRGPDHIHVIMDLWRGTSVGDRTIRGPRPTETDFAALSAFIADPVGYTASSQAAA
jgi:hypothetical protein